uniref:Uncharacterized protein n=1 Tax=Rhizophora mucronata TaxID=61149 RepID=A0A2P2PBE0_RHIMU
MAANNTRDTATAVVCNCYRCHVPPINKFYKLYSWLQ